MTTKYSISNVTIHTNLLTRYAISDKFHEYNDGCTCTCIQINYTIDYNPITFTNTMKNARIYTQSSFIVQNLLLCTEVH